MLGNMNMAGSCSLDLLTIATRCRQQIYETPKECCIFSLPLLLFLFYMHASLSLISIYMSGCTSLLHLYAFVLLCSLLVKVLLEFYISTFVGNATSLSD